MIWPQKYRLPAWILSTAAMGMLAIPAESWSQSGTSSSTGKPVLSTAKKPVSKSTPSGQNPSVAPTPPALEEVAPVTPAYAPPTRMQPAPTVAPAAANGPGGETEVQRELRKLYEESGRDMPELQQNIQLQRPQPNPTRSAGTAPAVSPPAMTSNGAVPMRSGTAPSPSAPAKTTGNPITRFFKRITGGQSKPVVQSAPEAQTRPAVPPVPPAAPNAALAQQPASGQRPQPNYQPYGGQQPRRLPDGNTTAQVIGMSPGASVGRPSDGIGIPPSPAASVAAPAPGTAANASRPLATATPATPPAPASQGPVNTNPLPVNPLTAQPGTLATTPQVASTPQPAMNPAVGASPSQPTVSATTGGALAVRPTTTPTSTQGSTATFVARSVPAGTPPVPTPPPLPGLPAPTAAAAEPVFESPFVAGLGTDEGTVTSPAAAPAAALPALQAPSTNAAAPAAQIANNPADQSPALAQNDLDDLFPEQSEEEADDENEGEMAAPLAGNGLDGEDPLFADTPAPQSGPATAVTVTDPAKTAMGAQAANAVSNANPPATGAAPTATTGEPMADPVPLTLPGSSIAAAAPVKPVIEGPTAAPALALPDEDPLLALDSPAKVSKTDSATAASSAAASPANPPLNVAAPTVAAPAANVPGAATAGTPAVPAAPTAAEVVAEAAPANAPAISDESAAKMEKIRERGGMKGLKGFCPVTLRDERELKDARTDFQAQHRGQKFHFATAEAKARFEEDPSRYAPAAYGADVVVLIRDKDVAEGTLDFAAWYKGKLYLFANEANHAAFSADPAKFATPNGLD